MSFGEVARGLSDVKVFTVGANDLIGTGLDVPGARSLEWSVDQNSEDTEGDDMIIASALDSGTGSGTLATRRMNLAAQAAMRGGTAVTTGTTPAQTIKLGESANGGASYVAIAGQSSSRDLAGSAYRVVLHKCRVASAAETLAYAEWNEPSQDITFIPNVNGDFITRVQYETAVAIPAILTGLIPS